MIASTTPIVISPTWTTTIGVASEISARYSPRVGRKDVLGFWILVHGGGPQTIIHDPETSLSASRRLVRRIEKVERDLARSQRVHQRAPVVRHAPRRDHV